MAIGLAFAQPAEAAEGSIANGGLVLGVRLRVDEHVHLLADEDCQIALSLVNIQCRLTC